MTMTMARESLVRRSSTKQPKATLLITIIILSFIFFVLTFQEKGDISIVPPLENNVQERRLKSKKDAESPREYTYIIIHYHKTGHDLTRSLVDMISNGIPGVAKPVVWDRRPMLRSFSSESKCPTKLKFQPGIYVLTAPNFFCGSNTLAEILLNSQESSFLRSNKNKPNRGVKIIHLVRNPFSLAASHYNYHVQYPTPESWVHKHNPCEEEKLRGNAYPDLLIPILSPVMNENDFRELDERCNSLFQNPERPELKTAGLYKHLRELDPKLGVQLSTLHMLTQVVMGGDITRMASNIISFNNLKHFVSRSNALHHVAARNPNEELIQIMSLSTDDFIVDPKGMARRFIDFCFGNTVGADIKRDIALKYEESYEAQKSGSHVTHNVGNADLLKESLRKDVLFGRVMGNIETVVEQALADSRGESFHN